MTFEIDGKYNSATVHLPTRDDVESECLEQIEGMTNSPAFEGDKSIAIMPDTHWGSGATIGFTMPVENRICPNTVGVDIGCGMTAGKVSTDIDVHDWSKRQEIDFDTRTKVPVGFNVHSHNSYHMKDDFPWSWCESKFESFVEHTSFDFDESPDYGIEYFKDLVGRVEYDMTRAIDSVGTLGGGNHFIEIGHEESNEDVYWVIVHSGSRGIGASIAQHWQDKAEESGSAQAVRDYFDLLDEEYTKYIKFDWNEVSDRDVIDWVQGGMGEKFFSYEDIKDDYQESDPKSIGKIGDTLDEALEQVKQSGGDHSYLEGEDAYGYIRDMVFAQTYAQESRHMMLESTIEAMGGSQEDFIESIHNYIDFEDGTIRKGACRAHKGERLIVPFNMSYGTLICRGKGKESWNKSSAHGAGRAMSRTEAKNRFDHEHMSNETEGVFMSETPLDETPSSYKDVDLVRDALGDNVEIEKRVVPLISIKAP